MGTRFTREMLTRPPRAGIDAVTTLRHFAIVTYAVEPERVRAHLHPRFMPDVVTTDGERALVSVVPFHDIEFRLARCPWPRFRFGQTNYRTYVIDKETGERCVWFFGTCLDSWSVAIPRLAWKLPWHKGRIRFDCARSHEDQRYEHYRMTTASDWAPAMVELEDTGNPPGPLPGFANRETAEVILTHPLRGVFSRRDGRLGSYSVWHDRLQPSEGRCIDARFELLDRLKLVPLAEQTRTHSVLIQHETEFTIFLPPRGLSGAH